MNIRYEGVVAHYIERYKSLLAWGGSIPKVDYNFERYKGQQCKGWANPRQGYIVVRLEGDLADDLRVVLHELAHLAAPNSEHHGPAWKRVYARAAAEAFDLDLDDFDLDVTARALDSQVREAATMWLACR